MLVRIMVVLFTLAPLIGGEGEWNLELSLEGQGFQNEGLFTGQDREAFSGSVMPEYYREWRNGDMSFTFKPFYRYDSTDDERSHFDIREFTWLTVSDKWELRVGVRKEFWGVTESAHLVDIINQTDLVENLDGEEKLGQPMINFAWITNHGTLDFFALTGFRERTFPGEEGRLRTPITVENDLATYESGAEEGHVDWAVRYSHSLGDWDIGLSHFWGTSREPLLQPHLNDDGSLLLAPYYAIIHQTGLDLQTVRGGWLLKGEFIHRQGFGDEDYMAGVTGFEYTFVGPGGTGLDVGAIAEYLYDERDERATTFTENDLFLGSRIAFNDAWSTEILAGAMIDLDGEGTFFNIEAERRLGQDWKLSVEARAFSGTEATDLLHGFRNEDHARMEITRYF